MRTVKPPARQLAFSAPASERFNMPRLLTHAAASVLAVFALLAGPCFSGRAADTMSPWLYQAYQTEEGLADNSITGLAQTDDGYLWVATRNGLMGFDGQKFSLMPQASLTPIASRAVRALFRDHRDQLWLAMELGPVLCLKHDGLDVFTSTNGLPSQNLTVLRITEDAAGAVWVVYSGQLRRILQGKVYAVELPAGFEGGGDLLAAADAQGAIWCAKGRRLAMWREGEWRLLPNFASPVRGIISDGKSKLWATSGDGLFALEEGQVPVRVATLPSKSGPKVLLADRAGGIWMGTFENGLFHWDGRQVESVPTSQRTINCLFEDREGNIWVGTEGGGLNQIRPRTAELVGRETGLPFEAAQSVAEDAEGCLWVVGQSGQLVRGIENRWEQIGDGTNWSGQTATCVAADASGGVWVGTSDHGLKYYRGGTWREWRRQDGLASDTIRSLMVSATGDVWVASYRLNRLHRLRDGQVQVINYPLPLGVIRALAETADGTIWIGTAEGQILQVSGSNLVSEPAIFEPFAMPVRSLLAAADGGLWIGYSGDGLGHCKQGRYQRLTTADGLADDFISQLLADDRGHLWINGDRGLSRISFAHLDAFMDGRLPKLNPQAFGRRDGLPALRPSRDFCPSATKTHAGQLVFAGYSGLLTVHPDQIRDNSLPPPVVLGRVRVDEQIIADYQRCPPLQARLATNALNLRGVKSALHLGPGHRKLEFDFAALSFTSPENVRFRYRMSGFDPDWVEADQSRRATYPRLPAGDYEFRVLACNNSGLWNETGSTLALTVSPFFWETWWFKIAGGLATLLLGGGCAYAISRARYRHRLRRLEAQRALEQERTRIARDIHDRVGAQLTKVGKLTEFLDHQSAVAEPHQPVLRTVSDTTRNIVRAMDEIVWAVNPRNDTLDNMVNYLVHYTEEYLGHAGVNCQLDVPFEFPSTPVSAAVRHNLFMATQEGLNNAVKHARPSQVCLRVVLSGNRLAISLEDDGCGFDPASALAGRNGLENMRQRLESVGGKFQLASAPGRGTRIHFDVALGAGEP